MAYLKSMLLSKKIYRIGSERGFEMKKSDVRGVRCLPAGRQIPSPKSKKKKVKC